MSILKTEVLEKSPEGEFILTERGEFLAYFDAHLKLFGDLLKSKNFSKEKESESLEGVRTFMEKNTLKTEHFFEQLNTFSTYLHTSKEDLGGYLTSHFMDTLELSQKKIKNQELDRLETGDAFKSILEEVLFKVGQILPGSSLFVFKDDLLVLQDKARGLIIKPVGLLGEVKEEQEKQKEKLEAEKLQKEKPKDIPEKKSNVIEQTAVPKEPTIPVAVFVQEVSILLEILEIPGLNLPTKKLEFSDKNDESMGHSQSESEISKPSETEDELNRESEPPAFNDVDDEIDMESTEIPIPQISWEDSDYESDPSEVENTTGDDGSLSTSDSMEEIERDDVTLEPADYNEVESDDLPEPEITEESILSEPDEREKVEQDEIPDLEIDQDEPVSEPIQTNRLSSPPPKTQIHSKAFQSFSYFHYLTLQRNIEKLKGNSLEYKKYLDTSTVVTKCFVSIQVNISKEISGISVDWLTYYQNLNKQTGVDKHILEEFKRTIQKLNLTKKALDIIISELKKQPDSVTKILKSGWPHFVDAFGASPDFNTVRENLKPLYERIKSDSIRIPIESIIERALKNLVKYCEEL